MKKFLLITLIGGLIAVPLVLLILPSDFFDHGESMCMSVVLLDTTCPGCGITGAIQHLIHFDFATAAAYNKLSFVVLPVLIFIWANELRKLYRKLQTLNKADHAN